MIRRWNDTASVATAVTSTDPVRGIRRKTPASDTIEACAMTDDIRNAAAIPLATGAGFARRPPHGGAGGAEVLFVDPGVPDISTILGHLRPGVEAILLDAARPAARQMAAALAGRRGLDAVHVIAHGAPGRARFAAGEWSAATLADDAGDLAAIGRALGVDGELKLWSCNTGEGAAGAAFVEGLAEAAGADVAAASSRVGAAAEGGRWRLKSRSHRRGALPPLTDAGAKRYSGVLADYIQINTNGAPVLVESGAYSIVAIVDSAPVVIGEFSVIKGLALNFNVRVRDDRRSYSVYSDFSRSPENGQITISDSTGKFNQQAAITMLGADGRSIAIRSEPSRPVPPSPAPVGPVGPR
jgi:hypothetical protein